MSEVKFIKFKKDFIEGQELSINEHLLLSYLSSLTKKDYCYATNDHLVEVCGIAKRTLCRVLNDLEDKDLIRRITKSTGRYGKDRKIYINPSAKLAYHSK